MFVDSPATGPIFLMRLHCFMNNQVICTLPLVGKQGNVMSMYVCLSVCLHAGTRPFFVSCPWLSALVLALQCYVYFWLISEGLWVWEPQNWIMYCSFLSQRGPTCALINLLHHISHMLETNSYVCCLTVNF